MPFTSFENICIALDFLYPVNLAQNVLTTGLITWKILRQHQFSTSIGLVSTDGISLITVTRIMVESALIYTVELIFLIILHFANSPVEFIVQAALFPSTGEEAFPSNVLFCPIPNPDPGLSSLRNRLCTHGPPSTHCQGPIYNE
jgi:hypothetical protein